MNGSDHQAPRKRGFGGIKALVRPCSLVAQECSYDLIFCFRSLHLGRKSGLAGSVQNQWSLGRREEPGSSSFQFVNPA